MQVVFLRRIATFVIMQRVYKKNNFYFFIFIFFLCANSYAQDSITKIRIKSKCKCTVDRRDSIDGNSSIVVDLQFEKSLSTTDFECYGFKLLRDGLVISCITNRDSMPFTYFKLIPGVYNLMFFADGYAWKKNPLKLKANDVQTEYFNVGMKQLPKFLREEIQVRRKKKK
jgi:hypothetical protein